MTRIIVSWANCLNRFGVISNFITGPSAILGYHLHRMIQRFEDEYPETRISPSAALAAQRSRYQSPSTLKRMQLVQAWWQLEPVP